jgi:hypothetical protein
MVQQISRQLIPQNRINHPMQQQIIHRRHQSQPILVAELLPPLDIDRYPSRPGAGRSPWNRTATPYETLVVRQTFAPTDFGTHVPMRMASVRLRIRDSWRSSPRARDHDINLPPDPPINRRPEANPRRNPSVPSSANEQWRSQGPGVRKEQPKPEGYDMIGMVSMELELARCKVYKRLLFM